MGRESRLPKDPTKSKGTICFCSGEAQVWPTFTGCLAKLAQQHPTSTIMHIIGTNVAASRNKAFRDMEGDWIYMIDTDMTFGPETVTRLLAHEVDVVQSLCLLRHPPHYPVLYGMGEDGQFKQAVLNAQDPCLIEVAGVGTGGTLFRRRVVEAIADPWFEVGQIKSEELGEDLYLSRKITKAGFKMWVDMTTPIGHLTPIAVWPTLRAKGEPWQTSYVPTAGPGTLVPAAGVSVPSQDAAKLKPLGGGS